jgi:glycosyltransferase involved in cell wall biosynthesis
MIAQFYPPTIGGEERMVHDLSVELAKRGHQVAVATLWHEGQQAREVSDGVTIYRIKSASARLGFLFGEKSRRYAPPIPDPGAVAGIKSVLAREQPEIVHGHNWLVHSFLPLRHRTGAALTLSLHDYSLVCANKRLLRLGKTCSGPAPVKCLVCSARHYGIAKGPPIAAGNALMYTAERSLVDLFLPVSEAVASLSRLAKTGAPYRVVPNFIRDPDASTPVEGLPALPDEFVLFVGDITDDKGVDVLLEAHAGLAERLPLVLVGRVRKPGLLTAAPADVHVVGPLQHDLVLEAWRRATIAVVPSSTYAEPFGLVALEAMSCGRPVIAARAGGLPEVVVDGESGILVRPGDAPDLRAALERLLADPDLRERLGSAAASRAGLFSVGTVLPQVEEAYSEALARRRSGR